MNSRENKTIIAAVILTGALLLYILVSNGNAPAPVDQTATVGNVVPIQEIQKDAEEVPQVQQEPKSSESSVPKLDSLSGLEEESASIEGEIDFLENPLQ